MVLKLVAVSLALVVILQVVPSYGGECCRSHVDFQNRYHFQKWCPAYCCGFATSGLYCCNDHRVRAFEGNIDRFCAAWFISSHNVWLLVVIGLIVLAILILSCVCCIKCCCGFVF